MSRRRIKNREALVEQHVQLHAEGLTHREIAKRTGVHHRTVQRDLTRWHEQLLRSLTEPWPQARRLRWLVDHPDDDNYPWTVAHSGASSEQGMRQKAPANGPEETP